MPDGFRPVAKAIVAVLVPLVSLLVAVGVLDIEIANKITAELIALSGVIAALTGAGVYATRNSPSA